MKEHNSTNTVIKTNKKYTKAKIKMALLAKIHGIPLNWILSTKTRNLNERKKVKMSKERKFQIEKLNRFELYFY